MNGPTTIRNGFTRFSLLTLLAGILYLPACDGDSTVFGGSPSGNKGGGSGSGSGNRPIGPNVQAVIVDAGPSEVANSDWPAVNTLYTTVTVCSPGSTTNCQTIDHIKVDTGTAGLRIVASVLRIQLPLQTNSAGDVTAECFNSAAGPSWGALRQADIKIAGETASKQAVQIIGDAAYTVPSSCPVDATSGDSVVSVGANGILGIGPYLQDCGSDCLQLGAGIYFTCSSKSTCADSAMPLALQLTNPVASFTTDNNGTILELPAVTDSARSIDGFLIFGIGTQSNNGLTNATVFIPGSAHTFSITYKNSTLEGWVDTGLNAYYFPDDTLNVCGSSGAPSKAPGFFCPPTTLNLQAGLSGANGTTSNINFHVANADTLFSNAVPTVAANLAGPSGNVGIGNGPASRTFELGLPFYFGRHVYTGIEGRNSSAGVGPYLAF